MKRINILTICLILSTVFTIQIQSFAQSGQATLKATTALGDTLGAFNAGALTPNLDQALNGVVFAEGHYWISGSNPQFFWQSMLYKFSADGQTLLDYWTFPSSVLGGIKELAYDGQYLYGTSIDTIYQIDMISGQLTGVKIPAPYYYSRGITYDPATDHFWVSGDGNLIYEINRQGNVVNTIGFPQDTPAVGLAWDTWSIGGPYLWVWSMKYTPSDVRPKAYQIKATTGQLTGVSFEGVSMFPPIADQALALSLSDEVIPGKVVFTALHGSSYQVPNDKLDWVILYDLDAEGTGIPGPIVNVDPAYIQNNLIFNDSIEIEITVSNLSDQFDLNWLAVLEYPEDELNPPGEVLLNFDGTELAAPLTENSLRSVVFLNGYFYIISRPGPNSNALLLKISADGSTVINSTELYFSPFGGSALTSDGTYLYATSQYVIFKFDPETFEIVDNIYNTNFSPNAMAVDPQNNLIYLAGNNAMKVINMQGQEVNFYILSAPAKGLSWDNWSPGGPFLWVYTTGENGPMAYRTHPQTGMQTGVYFEGTSFGNNDSIPDTAGDVFVTPDWQQNTLVLIALQKSTDNIGQLSDQVVVYDLATIPPPGWIDLLGSTAGTTAPLSSDTLTLKLKAIMPDTLMTANVVINNNTITNPSLKIPVVFEMMPDNTVSVGKLPGEETGVVQQVFPNPATDHLNVKLGNMDSPATIVIFNSLGVKVLSSEIMPGTNTRTIDISRLPAGFYSLMLSTGNSSERRTFIKK